MYNGISRSSGSIYPDKSILQRQLNPEEYVENYKESDFESSVLNGRITLWSKSYLDVPRLTKLIINNVPLYDTQVQIEEAVSEIEDSADKTQEIFDEMLLHFNRDTDFTRGVCNLANQGLALQVKNQMNLKKGISKGEDSIITHMLTPKEKVTVVDTDEKTFTFVQEQLYEERDLDDIDKITYLKAKTIVSGKISDLSQKKFEKLDFKVAYTKEYQSIEEARKSDYLWTKAGGTKDWHSYIQ